MVKIHGNFNAKTCAVLSRQERETTASSPVFRKAIDAAPDQRVVAGLMGNLGALMMGAHGSLERALEYTESAIQAGVESSMRNSEVVGGMSQILLLPFSTP